MKWFLLAVATVLTVLACIQHSQAQVIVYSEPVAEHRTQPAIYYTTDSRGNRYACDSNSCRAVGGSVAASRTVVVSEYRQASQSGCSGSVGRSSGPIRSRLRGRLARGCGG